MSNNGHVYVWQITMSSDKTNNGKRMEKDDIHIPGIQKISLKLASLEAS
jgi:hypothetical protein